MGGRAVSPQPTQLEIARSYVAVLEEREALEASKSAALRRLRRDSEEPGL